MSNMWNWPSHLTIQLLPPVSVINTQQKHDHKPLPWSRVTGKKPGKKLLEVVFVVCTMFWPLCTLFCYLLPREASIAYSCHMWVGLHNSLTHSLAPPTPDLPNFREQNKRTNSIYVEQPTQNGYASTQLQPTSEEACQFQHCKRYPDYPHRKVWAMLWILWPPCSKH